METKRNDNSEHRISGSFRLCLLLMALVLLTLSLTLGTIGRYSTSGGTSDFARAAKFGVTLTASDHSSFSTKYTSGDGTITVQSSTGDKIVAPGTNDGGITFAITGTPEVKTRIVIGMSVLDDIFYQMSEKKIYRPVIFTLSCDGDMIAQGNLTEIESAINNYTADYNVNDTIDTLYTLSWAWPYQVDSVSDAQDTMLGDIAAGLHPEISADAYSLSVGYAVTITVYQVVN